MIYILDLETSGLVDNPNKCPCGGGEFTPRLRDNSPDVQLVCKKCGRIHTVKAEDLDSPENTAK